MRVKPLRLKQFQNERDLSKWVRECPSIKYYVWFYKPSRNQLLEFLGGKDPSPQHIKIAAKAHQIPGRYCCAFCPKILECGVL